MKIGIYTNKSKDVGGIWSKKLHGLLEQEGIEYADIEDGNFSAVNPACGDVIKRDIDIIIVLGGDGTILGLSTFAAKKNIPIIGINAGKLGFLTEFETFEMPLAVQLIKSGKLKEDKRTMLKISIGGADYYALNDCVIQRLCGEDDGSLIANVSVSVDNNLVDKILGDGLIISTPTGSTAYSLSAGGPILAPGIESFCITPVSAHSLHHRPIIYASSSEAVVTIDDGGAAGLLCDGKLVKKLSKHDIVTVTRAENQVTFLRKKDSNFYNRLLLKLNNGRI